jgi:trk system potassium uptake protein TrkA
VVAVTGDDEDNIVICQMAREHYGVEKVIARVNDPRNQPLFDLTGISPTVSATSIILAMIEHEVPEHGLIHLLELRKENLEIVEVQLDADSPSVGKKVSRIQLPAGSRLITVMRDGQAQMAEGETELRAGDQVLAVLEPGKEEELRKVLLRKGG